MADLIALMLHLERGDRFLAPAQAHVLGSGLGTAAWLAGGMPEALAWDEGPGRVSPLQLWKAIGTPGAGFELRTALLCLENTHQCAGGACLTVEQTRLLTDMAHDRGLKVHLDGARLWHAAAATGDPLPALAAGADTVSVCLSKGLGAPMGSLLCGPRGPRRAGATAPQDARRRGPAGWRGRRRGPGGPRLPAPAARGASAMPRRGAWRKGSGASA